MTNYSLNSEKACKQEARKYRICVFVIKQNSISWKAADMGTCITVLHRSKNTDPLNILDMKYCFCVVPHNYYRYSYRISYSSSPVLDLDGQLWFQSVFCWLLHTCLARTNIWSSSLAFSCCSFGEHAYYRDFLYAYYYIID